MAKKKKGAEAANFYLELPRSGPPEKFPPPSLWEGYGNSPEEYLHTGENDTRQMLDILGRNSFKLRKHARILDLGCASGRMIRVMRTKFPKAEIWGADIDEKHVSWCNTHLARSLKFLQIPANVPHLPFEDRSFDLIYAGSVFTHIDFCADAWLVEMLRILKNNGRLYITINDNDAIKTILDDVLWRKSWIRSALAAWDPPDSLLKLKFEKFGFRGEIKHGHVFYDAGYLRSHWGRFAQVEAVVPNAYGFQTAYVLSLLRRDV